MSRESEINEAHLKARRLLNNWPGDLNAPYKLRELIETSPGEYAPAIFDSYREAFMAAATDAEALLRMLDAFDDDDEIDEGEGT